MHYDIQLGFLAADAISELSKATNTKDEERYLTFLERSVDYCKALRQTYGHPVEADITANMPDALADFMRTVIRNHHPSPSITAKLEAADDLEALLQAIREAQRIPSDEECLKIARTIYATSAADLR